MSETACAKRIIDEGAREGARYDRKYGKPTNAVERAARWCAILEGMCRGASEVAGQQLTAVNKALFEIDRAYIYQDIDAQEAVERYLKVITPAVWTSDSVRPDEVPVKAPLHSSAPN